MTPRRPTRSASRRGSRGSGTHPGQSSAPARSGSEREAPEEPAAPVVVERGVPPRVATLVVVALIAFAVVFTSLRAYLSQRAQYDDVVNELARAKATSTALEQELAQWQDETYVRSQVRERLGYVMPGETTYVVVGADGLGQAEDGGDPEQDAQRAPWYLSLQESVRVAGGTEPTQAPTDPAQRGWAPSTPQPSAHPSSQPSTQPGSQPSGAKPAPQETP